jgi:aspartokinase
MEQAIISGVAQDRGEAKITVVGVPDKVGEAARIFRAIADASINIDMIVQNVSAAATGRTDISFTLPRDDGHAGMAALRAMQDEVGFEQLLYDDRIGTVSVVGVPDRIGEAAGIFRVVAAADINIDMIVQNVSAVATGRTDISFTLPRDDAQAAMSALQQLQGTIGFESLLYDDRIGKVSLIGAGMRSHPGVTAAFFGALAEAGVNIEMISTSEIRISVVVDQKDVDEAVNATHKAFELDADEVEAVVYGGTGR